ncbi:MULTISPECIES: choice-of-anchor J domain-containing protein [Flavobacterium]|uniref:choice-of-anchor J domain-containing protein n=1 Tax=Flavobacterium TaxID=237 RepID=UPI001FCBA5D2|nr:MULTISPECIES: choice-of-anchor J domain-containing protein [Flavobacterium]UOK43088.1 choice-of-anchor J domain-containing protein [Flavobacterium enshiense]
MKKITLVIFMSLLSFLGYAQFPESFDTGIPAAWHVTDNGVGLTKSWVGTNVFGLPHSGAQHAMVDREDLGVNNTSEDWLVTPQFTVPTNAQLRFWTKTTAQGDSGTLYQLRISTTSQTDRSSFTTFKQWTELDLEALAGGTYNVYGEAVQSLTAYAGQSVYIAFVKLHTQTAAGPPNPAYGDRWILDDVNVLQQCTDPSTLTATQITPTTAQLGWTSPGPATSWDIEMMLSTDTPTGIPTPIQGVGVTNPVVWTGLTPATNYKYYVRSVCSTGATSNWVGPFAFKTIPYGQTCAAPIAITTALPFTHTSHTNLYGDVVDGSPGASCGITANYLNGNDVFYAFTPSFTGVVDITMTPTGNASGLFVYGSCANVGSICLAGVANAVGTPRNIPFFAVTAGTTYYIVISTSGTPQTIPYTLNIQQVGCPPPNNLGASGISQTGATLTWGNPSGATAWEYVFQAQGGGLPTGAGTPSSTTSATVGSVTPLIPNTSYEFYVRVDCGGGTYSVWAGPFVFRTLCAAYSVPFTEGFNSASTTQACWTVLNVDGDTNSWNMNYTANPAEGNEVASILSGSVSNNDWLISPQITLNGNQRLKYRYRVESAASVCTFEVRYSTNGTSPADLTNVLVAPATYNNTTYIDKTVNMTGVTGNVNIGWYVAPGTNGSRIYIDNVIVEDIPACPEPMALAVSNIGPTSATISWTPGGTESSWQVLVQPAGSPAPTLPTLGVNVTTTPPYNYTLLNGSTNYDVYVLANCGASGPSVWIGPVTFRTPQLPGTLPYSDTFEGTFEWDLVNGTQVNQWRAGTAANNGGTRSMYISNDNGVTNFYRFNGTPTALSIVQAYRDIQIPATASQVNVAFDWRAVGESIGATQYDYFRVWLVPATFVPTAGTQITAASGGINLSGNMNLGSATAFARRNIVVNTGTFAGQTVRLVFEWRNDGTGGANPPAAIDNIDVTVITCPAPTAQTVTAVTQTSATFQWAAGAAETQWEIVVQPVGAGQPTASSTIIPAGTNPFTVSTDLLPATNYEYFVRAVCTPGTDVSTWTGPFAFSTTQYPVTMPYTEDFEGTFGWNIVNGTQTNKWVVGSAVYYAGSKSLYITNDNGTSNAYTLTAGSTVQAYKDIQIPAGTNQVNVAFDWRAQGEGAIDYFRVWAVPTTYVPTAGTQITPVANERINLSGNINQGAAWSRRNLVFNVGAYAGQTFRLVFEWRNDTFGGTQPPAAIDNVNVTVITCPAPTAPTVVSVTDSTATVQWTAGAAETQWEVVVQPAGTGQPTGSSTILQAGVNPFTITGLSANTNYEYYVRAVCTPSTDVSTWTGPKTFITSQVAATIPYTEGFEGTSGWATVNGAQTNKWFEGIAANNGGTRALYVSNDNGTTNAYTNTTTSTVHAYRDIAVPATCAQEIKISFDWRSVGQAAQDYLNVWLVPSTYLPVAGTAVSVAASGGAQLANQLSLGASFVTNTYTFNATAYAGRNMRVIFEWRNNASAGTNPPAAVDNFKVELPTCPKPFNLSVVGTPGQTTTNVTWSVGCTETAWEVIALPAGSPAPTAATAGTSVTTPPPYTITGLQPATNYDFYVRAVCIAGTDVSGWSAPKAFMTFIENDECDGAMTVPVNANDQCTQVKAAMFNGATVSTVGGTTCGANNSGDIWFKFTATNASHTVDFRDFNANMTLPIMMTVYSGDCGSLTQIACNYNNSSTVTGLQIGNTYFVRASINTVTTVTNVNFKVCVKTPVAPASGTSLSCKINTVNPSFEEGVLFTTGSSPRWADLYDHMFLGWRTTAADNHMELWSSASGVLAHDGDKFIELNATLVSGVYQDFPTPVTTVFSYQYAHRARRANMPPDVVKVMAGPPGGPYVEIDRRTSDTSKWTYNQIPRTYTVPAGQTVTRFIFEAVRPNPEPAGYDITQGNFLDNITFTADNSIVSASPLSLDCLSTNVTNVVAAGAGTWSADPSNPAATTIANPDDNATTISGFTVSGTYRYNWTTLYCTSSVDIVYTDNGNRLPEFTQPAPVCASTTATDLLPTTSNNGIVGVWSPAFDNTATAMYTFTPNAGQCAVPTTMTITVDPNTTPTFAQPAAICAGEVLAALPTQSENGINGTWSPDLDNTTTTEYTFTPDPNGPCAVPTKMTITVTPNTTPTFAPVAPICRGEALAALPTTSDDGVTGTWDPALDNTQTTEYTFTPDAGQCAVVTKLTITVNQLATATFAAMDPICMGDTSAVLPATSVEGFTGVWTPAALDYTNTTTYLFTPDAGQCAAEGTLTVDVIEKVAPTFADVTAICPGEALTALPKTSLNGITGTWSPPLNNMATTIYTFTPDAGQCATSKTLQIEVKSDCDIPRGISPNNDGSNDELDLTDYGVNKLSIFNRYGVTVYSHGAGYTKQWHGQSDAGQELPDGTYYYVINLGTDVTKTGWIYINREQ